MRDTRNWTRQLTWSLALALLAVPAFAELTIESGADLWQTAGSGATFSNFGENPIPAGFFCDEAPAFTGKIALEGAPLTTDPPGILGYIDTVVHRLDDTTFDLDGVATTRVQLMALSLASPEPVDVGCDRLYDISVSLDGEQPITEMRIHRENENGGTYVAPLALQVKTTFTPVGGDASESVHLSRLIELGPGNDSYWTTTDRVGEVDGEKVLVDTNGDGIAESAMPGPSNFAAGLRPASACKPTEETPTCPFGLCPYQSCHCDPCSDDPYDPNDTCDHLHCIWVCVPPPPGMMCTVMEL